MGYKSTLLAGCASLASLMTLGVEAASAQARPQADQASELETVVVSARRRAEQLLDVPAAVSALTARQIEELPVEVIEDYLRQTPAASVVFAGPDYLKDVSLRGQGGGRNGFSASATGIYRNGVFIAGGGFGGRSLNALDLFDVQSFEVYRGPQGALFGRNAVGGAVNVISQAPGNDARFRFQVAYDDRDRLAGEAVANMPFSDGRAALRVGIIGTDQTGGFITDQATGDTIDYQDFLGLRAAVRVDLTDSLSTTLTYERSESDSPGFSVLGRRLPTPARPTATFDPDVNVRAGSRYGRVEIEEDTIFMNVEQRLGFADLSVVVANRERDGSRFNEDLDRFLGFQNISGSDLVVGQYELFTKTAVEARLASNGDGPLQWLVGVDWQTSDDTVTTINEGVTTSAALRELATRTDVSTEDFTSSSIFGSVDYAFNEQWSGSLEARFQSDESSSVFRRIDRVPTPTNTSLGPISSEVEFSRFMPGATLKWAYAPNHQAYVRVASAYRPSGFNAGTSDPAAVNYDPETSIGGELGLKGRLGGWLRYGVSAYRQTLDDAQIVTSVSATDTTTVLQNVEGVDYWGLELELSSDFNIGPGVLATTLTASTQDGEFKDGSSIISTGVTYDLSGFRVNRVRDLTASITANYAWRLGPGRAYVTATLTGEGGGYENAIGSLKVAGVSRSSPSYMMAGLRAGWSSREWSASVYVNNLFDEVYATQEIQSNVFYNQGRVIGVRLARSFGY